MQEITTVSSTIQHRSHSDKDSYKNLPQSDCTVTALLQLGPTAGAEGGETVTGNTDWPLLHSDEYISDVHTSTNPPSCQSTP